jgi:hypothetical protein
MLGPQEQRRQELESYFLEFLEHMATELSQEAEGRSYLHTIGHFLRFSYIPRYHLMKTTVKVVADAPTFFSETCAIDHPAKFSSLIGIPAELRRTNHLVGMNLI